MSYKKSLFPVLLSFMMLFMMACACSLLTPTYVPVKAGDCFVPPQGDPVYDQFYAEHVNPDNCASFKDQAQAHEYDANAKKIMAEEFQIRSTTNMNIVGATFTVLIVIGLAVVLIILKLKG